MSQSDIIRISDPDVFRTSEPDVTSLRPQDVPWTSETSWDEWSHILTKLWLLILMSLGQFMDVGPLFRPLLDVLWTSEMSRESQILSKLWMCKQMSSRCPDDVNELLWSPILTSLGCSTDVESYVRSDVRWTKKVPTKWGKYDVVLWRHTDQNLTSFNVAWTSDC